MTRTEWVVTEENGVTVTWLIIEDFMWEVSFKLGQKVRFHCWR